LLSEFVYISSGNVCHDIEFKIVFEL